MSQRAFVVGLIAILSSAPLVAAWGFKGDKEPSTLEDVNGGYMWDSPYTGSLNKVYFNGFVSQTGPAGSALNPNVVAAHTEITGVWFSFHAILGVWADCNNDGYIGLSETGAMEYRSEVLNAQVPIASQSPECKAGAPAIGNAAAGHNDGNWVREYIPISWSPADGRDGDGKENGVIVDDDIYNIDSNSTRVWVDYNLGGVDGGHGGCLVNPQTGSTQSTGGFLEWADCGTGFAVIGAINLVAANTNPGLGFSDKPGDEWHSAGTLNVWNPYGQQSDPSYVDAYDCSGTKTFAPRDPTSPSDGQPGALYKAVSDPTWSGTPNQGSAVVGDDNDGKINGTFSDGYLVHGANVSAISSSPTTHAPVLTVDGLTKPGHPSPAGTLNATAAGTDKCNRNTDADHPNNGNTLGNAPYSQEAGFPAASVRIKNDDWMTPTNANRPAHTASVRVHDPQSNDPNQYLVNQALPEPLGHSSGMTTEAAGPVTVDVPFSTGRVDVVRSLAGIWTSAFTHIAEGPGFDSNNAKTMGIVNATYYGYVTPSAFLTVKAPVNAYGSNDEINGAPAECGGNILSTPAAAPTLTNIFNGWDCKTGDWYHDGAGADIGNDRSLFLGCDQNDANPNQHDPNTCTGIRIAGTVGDPYNLKDFDCWDMSADNARQQGVSTGPIGWWAQPGKVAKCSST